MIEIPATDFGRFGWLYRPISLSGVVLYGITLLVAAFGATVAAAFLLPARGHAPGVGYALWEALLLGAIVAPLVEEAVFRLPLQYAAEETWLMKNKRGNWVVGASVVASATLFALMHGIEVHSVYFFVVGLLQAFLYLKAGGAYDRPLRAYLCVVVTHMVWNGSWILMRAVFFP